MSTQDSSSLRRGWCPGVRRPMATGDGLLVRLHPFGGRLTAHQARLVAKAAREHGNGHLDITARGNLQIRGVSDETYPALLAQLDREGLVEPEGNGPNRLTTVSPLAGLDPREHFDGLALAQAIERNAGAIEGVPAKCFIAVDGGGAMPLDSIGADLHLVAAGNDDAVAFGLTSRDGLRWIGAASLDRAPEAAVSVLAHFVAMRREGRTEARRLRDLQPDLIREFVERAALTAVLAPRRRLPASRAGAVEIGNGVAALLALPFGRCRHTQLEQAAAWSERFGTGEMRLSFTRGVLLPGMAREHLTMLLVEADRTGFITKANDPRLSLLACPGRPDCASARTPAPADALRIAGACGNLLERGASLHVSGCRKGCAHPGKADLTLVGRDDGRYDVVPDGPTHDVSSLHLSIDELMTRLSPLKTFNDLRSAFTESTR